MTINCAFIGFGKSTTRYHLPYVLHRKATFHVAHIFRRHPKPELESHPRYQHIHFTSDLDDILNDDSVKLVVICTHADSHFDYAKRALEAGKNVLVEKPFTTSVAHARLLLDLAKRLPEDGMFFGLGVHTMDQIISLFGRPDHVSYDIRSLRNKANPDDTFEAQLFYGDLKAIVKTSHYVKIDYPKFTVHGKKGSFIKYGIDQQETSLKAGIMPGEPGFAADESIGHLEYVNAQGETVREEIKPEEGDYGRVYDALYDTLVNGAPNYVRESDVLTNLEILERGFEQASPATVTLAK